MDPLKRADAGELFPIYKTQRVSWFDSVELATDAELAFDLNVT